MAALTQGLARAGQAHWLAVYAIIALAWAGLMAGAVEGGRGAAMLWADLCRADAGIAGFPAVLAMWALMGAAMMLPTFVPALSTYDDLIAAGAGTRAGFARLAMGYLAVWLGFAGIAAAAQIALAGSPRHPPGWRRVADRRRRVSVQPVEGRLPVPLPRTADRLSGRHAARWGGRVPHRPADGRGLPGLLLGADGAGADRGAMTLLWMGLAMLMMTLEKLPRLGVPLTRPLGAALIGAGLATLFVASAAGDKVF